MKFEGRCHCGEIRFQVEGSMDRVIACNCSMCRRKGSLLWFVPREDLKLAAASAEAGTYLFNKHVIQHRFCKRCGIHPYAEGTDPSGKAVAAINVRCLEDVDLETLDIVHFDGRSK